MVNAITMEPRTIKRGCEAAALGVPVQSVLHLIDIIGQSCDQGGGSKTVKLRIGKSLYMIKHRLTKPAANPVLAFCCKKLGGDTDSQTCACHKDQNQKSSG